MVELEVEDIIVDILLCLPPKSLSRCKSLAKEWYAFISYNKSFRQRYLRRQKQLYRMIGFITTKDFKLTLAFYKEPSHFLPTSMHGRRRRMGPSWPLDGALSFVGQKDEPHVVATSNGFLLCWYRYLKNYVICNPMNKQCLHLPTPNVLCEVRMHGFVWYSTSPCVDKVDYYKVVRALQGECANPKIEIFSSDSLQWKLVYLPIPFIFYSKYPAIAIVEQELVYFAGSVEKEKRSFDQGIAIYDQRKHSAELLLYPHEGRSKFFCFGKTDGVIQFARFEPWQIKVWMLNYNHIDACGWEWSLKHTVDVEPYPNFIPSPMPRPRFVFIAFHPLNPNIIFIERAFGEVMLYDLENSQMEFNFNKSEEGVRNNNYILPYTYGLIGPHLFLEG